jgi:DNA-binding NtrC family response regulator
MVQDLGMNEKSTFAEMRPGGFDLTELTPDGIDFPELQKVFEQHYYDAAMKLSGGNESKAAKLLNINLHTFRYRRKKSTHF